MARLPALAEAVAGFDFRPPSLIAQFGRQVRDDGLIVSRGKGTAASDMTFADAATFLMAVCGAYGPAGAKRAVLGLRELELFHSDDMDRDLLAQLPSGFAFLREGLNFGRVLEHMIAEAPALARWEASYLAREVVPQVAHEMAELSMGRMVEKVQGYPFRPGFARPLRIICHVPGIAAEIQIGWPWRQIVEKDALHLFYAADVAQPNACPNPTLLPIEVGVAQLAALREAVLTPSVQPRRKQKAQGSTA